MNNKKLLAIPALALVVTLGLSSLASADTLGAHLGANVNVSTPPVGMNVRADSNSNVANPGHGPEGDHMMDGGGVWGTVTAVNGTTVTLQSKTFTKGSTTSTATSYTIDASKATVDKDKNTIAVSAIAVGDTVLVEGTVTGTNVVATKIHDGIMVKGVPGSNGGVKMPSTIPNGNGQPIIGGKVTAVSGNTVTITNTSNIAYTIDVTNAKITKNGTTSTVSNVAVGDNVLAQGTINGTSVAAVNVVDTASTTTTNSGTPAQSKGILGMIGGFFSKLFGF